MPYCHSDIGDAYRCLYRGAVGSAEPRLISRLEQIKGDETRNPRGAGLLNKEKRRTNGTSEV